MANLDHIQRSNADKQSCQNCCYSSEKFNHTPCEFCKGTNDMWIEDKNKPAVLTGRDFGWK